MADLRGLAFAVIGGLAASGCFHGETALFADAAAPCPLAAPTVLSRSMIDPQGNSVDTPHARITPNGTACVVESLNPSLTGFDVARNLTITTYPLGEDWHIAQIDLGLPDDHSVDLLLVRLPPDRLEIYNARCSDLQPGAHARFGMDTRCVLIEPEQAERVFRALIALDRPPIDVYRRADA